MAYCGSSVGTWGNPPVYQIQTLATNPTDLGTCNYVLMPGTEYKANLTLAASPSSTSTACTAAPVVPYDYATGSAFWAFGFTGVMVLYFTSHIVGLVLKMLRRY